MHWLTDHCTFKNVHTALWEGAVSVRGFRQKGNQHIVISNNLFRGDGAINSTDGVQLIDGANGVVIRGNEFTNINQAQGDPTKVSHADPIQFDGAVNTVVLMEPVAFLRRLVGIIPPPRRHLVRYRGIFGPASKHRHALRALVPADPAQSAGDAHCAQPRSPASTASRARRLPWADLLRRVFADDVLQCPCGGRRSVVAIVTDTALAWALLAGLGLATEPGQQALECAASARCC